MPDGLYHKADLTIVQINQGYLGNYCKVDVEGNLQYIENSCNLECFFENTTCENTEAAVEAVETP